MSKIHDIFQKLSNVNLDGTTQDLVDDITKDIKEILIEPARNTGMFKLINPKGKFRSAKENKPWFNEICKNSKKNYLDFKKSLPKQPNETDKTNLKTQARAN